MTLASTGAIITDAVAEGAGVGAFNLIQLETLEAIVAGAEQAGLPVILQISENTVDYHGALAPIAAAALAAAAAARVPVAVHLDHVTSPQLVTQAIALGIPSVMFDASALHYAQNVAQTAHVTRECHAAGVWVEAELGKVGGKDGAHAPGVRTDPDEAISFVRATGVDALAVAVGEPGRSRTSGDDQGQHRHPPQRTDHLHGANPPRLARPHRPPQVPRPNTPRGQRRSRPPAAPAAPRQQPSQANPHPRRGTRPMTRSPTPAANVDEPPVAPPGARLP